MISYSSKAAKALGYLKRYYNDIEIFVEDTSNNNMWIRLIERILPSSIKISSVNVLGGRSNVLEACKQDQQNDGRRKLYIVDADFDFLLGRPKKRLKHLYRVRGYCVENILLHPESVIEAGLNNCTNSNRRDISDCIDYRHVFSGNEELLRNLFVVYAAAEAVSSGIPTVSYSVYKLSNKIGGRYELNKEKIRTRIREVVRDACRAAGAQKFSQERKAISLRATKLNLDQIVSGKNYLLPIVWERLTSLPDCSVRIDQFKVQLAREFKASYEPWLARRLMRGASN